MVKEGISSIYFGMVKEGILSGFKSLGVFAIQY
jgi:hypothetical protein